MLKISWFLLDSLTNHENTGLQIVMIASTLPPRRSCARRYGALTAIELSADRGRLRRRCLSLAANGSPRGKCAQEFIVPSPSPAHSMRHRCRFRAILRALHLPLPHVECRSTFPLPADQVLRFGSSSP